METVSIRRYATQSLSWSGVDHGAALHFPGSLPFALVQGSQDSYSDLENVEALMFIV